MAGEPDMALWPPNEPVQASFCGLLRPRPEFWTHSCRSSKQMPARHPQIGQGKQRVELGRVLGQTAIAHLHMPKLAFDDAERVLCLGSDLSFGALNLINE